METINIKIAYWWLPPDEDFMDCSIFAKDTDGNTWRHCSVSRYTGKDFEESDDAGDYFAEKVMTRGYINLQYWECVPKEKIELWNKILANQIEDYFREEQAFSSNRSIVPYDNDTDGGLIDSDINRFFDDDAD
jgi:hypothetical protein